MPQCAAIRSVVVGPPYLAESEIAVVRPEGGGRFSAVGRIALKDWPSL